MRVRKYCCVHIIAPPPRFPPSLVETDRNQTGSGLAPAPPPPMLTSTKYTHQSRIRARPRHRAHTPGFASGPNPMKLFEIQIQPWGLVWTIDQDLGLPPMSVACPPTHGPGPPSSQTKLLQGRRRQRGQRSATDAPQKACQHSTPCTACLYSFFKFCTLN